MILELDSGSLIDVDSIRAMIGNAEDGGNVYFGTTSTYLPPDEFAVVQRAMKFKHAVIYDKNMRKIK